MGTYMSSFDLLLRYDLAMRRFDEAERELDGLHRDVLTLLKNSPGRAIGTGTHLYWTEDGTFIQSMERPPYTIDVDLPDSLKTQPAPEPDPAAKLDAAMAEDADAAQCWAKATPTDSLKGSVLHYAEPFEPAVDPSDFDAVREPKPLSGGAPEADATMHAMADAFRIAEDEERQVSAEVFGAAMAGAIFAPLRKSNEAAIQHIDETLDRLRTDYRNETP